MRIVDTFQFFGRFDIANICDQFYVIKQHDRIPMIENPHHFQLVNFIFVCNKFVCILCDPCFIFLIQQVTCTISITCITCKVFSHRLYHAHEFLDHAPYAEAAASTVKVRADHILYRNPVLVHHCLWWTRCDEWNAIQFFGYVYCICVP